MKFRAQYLWAYLLIIGLTLMFLPFAPIIGGNYEEEGAPESARLLGMLSYFAVPLILVGFILAVVQFIRAGTSRPAPVATSDMSDVTSADSPAAARNTTLTTGIITMVVGVVIVFLPLIIASISTTPGHNMWNEADSSSGAAALWLLLITIPVGGITSIVGLVLVTISAVRGSRK